MHLWHCACRLFPARDSWFCEFYFRCNEYLSVFFFISLTFFCTSSHVGFKKQRCVWKRQVCSAGELLDRAEFSKFSLYALTRKRGPQVSKCWNLVPVRKPWSTWGPNILHAWDKTNRCTILSGKREQSSATRRAAFGTIALDVSKPQRRNARSVAFFSPFFIYFNFLIHSNV